jgi:hypothetical protein
LSAQTKPKFETREQWLQAALEGVRPLFKSAGYTIPKKIRVSCGYPATGGTRLKNKRIGECHPADNSADHSFEIFIHPQQADPILPDGSGVLETLVHEIGHATVGLEHGHKAPFARFCKAVGLDGKPTATQASENLIKQLQEVETNLGPYPHAALQVSGKKQGTRLLAVRCTQCECVVRMTAKWLDEVGPPTCGCGAPMQEQTMMDPDMISLKTMEQMIMYASPDDRFGIMFTKDRQKGQSWILVDYQENNRTTYCDDRQDCFDTITAIREGMHVYTDVEVEDEDNWFEYDEFEEGHLPFFEALLPDHHLPHWQEEDPDFPVEDMVDTYKVGTKVVDAPTWETARDNYGDEDEPVEVVPRTRPAPKPETIAFFGAEHLRA